MKSGSMALAPMALLALITLTACQTTGTTPEQTAAATTPPAGAEVVAYNAPPVGATWTYSKDGETETWQRLSDGTYSGQSVMRVDTGNGATSLLAAESGNWVTSLDANDKPMTSASPDLGTLQWPLWVGKKWTATYTYLDHKRNKSWVGGQTFWTAEASEDVTTPAGTFRAFRLQSVPGKHNATKQTIWFAPELGIMVKQVFRRTSNHYLGAGGYERVLVSYSQAGA